MDVSTEALYVGNEANHRNSNQDGSFEDGKPLESDSLENRKTPQQKGDENIIGLPKVCDSLMVLSRREDLGYTSNHKIDEHAKSNWNCNLCRYTATRKYKLLQHCKTAHTTIRDFKCDQCEYSTSWKKELIRHSKAVHLNIKEFKCDQCTREFTQKGHLKSHKRTVHEGMKEFRCDKCSFDSNTRYKMEHHKKEVHEYVKTHACEYCAFSTSIPANLMKHKRVVHMTQCEDCDRVFAKKSNMIHHMITVHNKGQKYKCGICGRIFIKGPDLNRHKEEVHDKTKEYKCDCGFSTVRNSNLTRHKKAVHLGLKEFKCDACNFACSKKIFLIRHKKSSHGIKDDLNENDSGEAASRIPSETTNKKQHPENSTSLLESQRKKNLQAADYFRKMQVEWAMQKKDPKEVEVELKMFKCSRCQYTAWSREEMTTHMMEAHAKRIGKVSLGQKESFNHKDPPTPKQEDSKITGMDSIEEKEISKKVDAQSSEHGDASSEAQMFPWILPDEQVEPATSKEVGKVKGVADLRPMIRYRSDMVHFVCQHCKYSSRNMSNFTSHYQVVHGMTLVDSAGELIPGSSHVHNVQSREQFKPPIFMDQKSNTLNTQDKPPQENESKKVWRVATKGVVKGDHPWSLSGMEDKIASVGNWLDKLKGKK